MDDLEIELNLSNARGERSSSKKWNPKKGRKPPEKENSTDLKDVGKEAKTSVKEVVRQEVPAEKKEMVVGSSDVPEEVRKLTEGEVPDEPTAAELMGTETDAADMGGEMTELTPLQHAGPALDEDMDDIGEIDESQRLHLEQVTSLVDAAYQRMKQYSRDSYLISSTAASEAHSRASTYHPPSSTDSLDGGQAEVDELTSLPSNMENLLKINQALQRRFTATLMKLEKTLEDNLQRQATLRDKETDTMVGVNREAVRQRIYNIRPSTFCIPYFKDKTGMPAPMNEDAKQRVDSGYFDLYSTKARTWMCKEMLELRRAVAEEAKLMLINEWNTKKKETERILASADSAHMSQTEREVVESEIDSYQEKINQCKETNADDMKMPPDLVIDWDKIAAQTFDGYRSAEECQLMWTNGINIDNSIWTEEEDVLIVDYTKDVTDDTTIDWDDLASKFKGKRTPLQVLKRYTSYIKPTLNPAVWNEEDSQKLIDTVNMLRVGTLVPWSQVGRNFVGFTNGQIQGRWRILDPSQTKGHFTVEEDYIIIKGLYKFGLNFKIIAQFLSGRTHNQVRYRFKRCILPGITNKPWTVKEDRKIIEMCIGQKSEKYKNMLMYLPARKMGEIRMRKYVLTFWQNLTDSIENCPPLFPLTITTKPGEIKRLRQKIVDNLDKSTKVTITSAADREHRANLSMFEKSERSNAVKKDKDSLKNLIQGKPHCAEKAAKVLRRFNPKNFRRKRAKVDPKWPDMALMEYFVTNRVCDGTSKAPELPDGPERPLYLKALMSFFQLKIEEKVKDFELDNLCKTDLDEMDVEAVNLMAEECISANEAAEEVVESCPEAIPLTPPSFNSLGTLKSVILHKDKLKEMCSKEFLFYNISKGNRKDLGSRPGSWKHSTKVPSAIKQNEERLNQENKKKVVTLLEQFKNIENAAPAEGGERKAKKRAMIINTLFSQPKSGTIDLEGKNKSSERDVAQPSDEELFDLQMGTNLPIQRVMEGDEVYMVPYEDKLLFHRFLSILYWPVMLMHGAPPESLIELTKLLVQEMGSLQKEDEEQSKKSEKMTKNWTNTLSKEEVSEILDNHVVYHSNRWGGKGSFIDETAEGKVAIRPRTLKKLKRSLRMRQNWDKLRESGYKKPGKVRKISLPAQGTVRSKRLSEKRLKGLGEKTVIYGDPENEEEMEAEK